MRYHTFSAVAVNMTVDIRWCLLLPMASFVSCFCAGSKNDTKESFRSQQKGVALGMSIGYGCTILSFLFCNQTFEIKHLDEDEWNSATVLEIIFKTVFPWFTFQAISLLWGIMQIAKKRFFNEKSIDGTQTSELEMDSRYLNNTLEQVVLSLMANIISLSFIAIDYNNNNNNNNTDNANDNNYNNVARLNGNLYWVILNCNMFFAGRILFWFYYLNYPHKAGKRSLGFALTFGPSVAAIIYSFFMLIKMLFYLT